MPTISVIVPVYKVEKYIHRCVDSILAQTFTDFELLLVDDGSPDSCGAICDEYAARDSRVRVFHQENKGQAAARNLALDWMYANSDSRYVSFVDSDDWVHPQYLELLFRALREHSTKISQCKHIWAGGPLTDEEPVQEKIVCVSPEEQYSKWFSAYFCGKLFENSFFAPIRFPAGQIFEDVAIWYKVLFQIDRIAIVDTPLYYYFQRPDNTTNSSWTPAKLAQVKAWDEQLEFASRRGSIPLLDAVLRKYCWVLKNQYEEIGRSTSISDSVRKKYQALMKSKMRKVLNVYKNELKRNGQFDWYFSWSFPRLHWCYWIWKGVCGKIKGKKK